MADVTGSIGNEYVELNNAATEATLKLLLQATLAANKQTLDQIKGMAKSSGIDPDTVERVNQENSRLQVTGSKLGAAFGAVSNVADTVATGFKNVSASLEEIVSGSGNISGTLGQLGKLPGVIGLVFTGMSKLIGYQEELLKTYQQLTRVGANFGGSLTDMRQAAADTFMTLEDFASVISENGQNFARMGITVNDGIKSFRNISNEINKSELGRELRALGLTTKEINDETIKYIASTGGRTKKELENTEALRKSTGEYLMELDALTKFTGVSKKQIEEEQKKAALNEAFQRKMASLDEAERAKLKAAYDKAAASGISGATELVMSTALGLPPVVKSAQLLSGIAPKAAEGINEMTKTAMTAGTTQKDVSDKFGKAMIGASEAAKNLGQTGDALVLQEGEQAKVVNGLIGAENKMRAKGITTQEEFNEKFAKTAEEQKNQQESEAKQAVETQQAVQKLGQEILEKLLPIVKSLWSVINPLITTVTGLFTALLKIPYLFETLGVVLAAVTALYAAHKVKLAVGSVRETVGGLFGGGGPGGGRPPTLPPIPGGGGGAAGAAGSLGSLGNVIQQIGPTIKSLGTGFGGAIKAIFTGIAGGLKAFANPMVMLGSVGFGIAIAAIGAGIAGATWLLGKALPTLSEGMKSFEQLDGEKLISAGKGIGALGLGLAAFGASSGIAAVGNLLGGLVEKFGSFLGIKSPVEKIKQFADMGPGLEKAGNGIKNFNSQLVILLNTDLSRTKEIVNSLNQIKAAAPGSGGIFSKVGENLSAMLSKTKEQLPPITPSAMSSFSDIFSKTSGQPQPTIPKTSEVKSTLKPPEVTPVTAITAVDKTVKPSTLSGKAMENLVTELQTLNKQSLEMLKYLKETAEYSRKNVDAVRGLNGDMFKF